MKRYRSIKLDSDSYSVEEDILDETMEDFDAEVELSEDVDDIEFDEMEEVEDFELEEIDN